MPEGRYPVSLHPMLRRLILLALLLMPTAGKAGDASEVQRRLDTAWAHFRDAFYQSEADHPDPAATGAALKAFLAAWSGLLPSLEGRIPPPPFPQDQDIPAEMRQIAVIARQAADQTAAGQLPDAHSSLYRIRAILADQRRRNDITSYDDLLDGFDEKLAEADDGDFGQAELTADQFVRLCEQLGVLAWLAEQLEKRAPRALQDDQDFFRRIEGVARQVTAVKTALLEGQSAAVIAALQALRRDFASFYFLYG
ncbi:MAG TPA: hypothetical protein HPP80_02070 [Rhodospirillaceae bacterium]|nr:hypothetical protein [Rhodospirillaceae bacterium]